MLAFVLAFAAVASAQQPNYFPLDSGDVWVYRCSGSCPQQFVTVQVLSGQEWFDTPYSLLRGWFGQDYSVREDQSGSVYVADQSGESLWYAFGTPVGVPFGNSGAMILSKTAHYQGPALTSDNALVVEYAGGSQNGPTGEIFMPYLGLVQRTESTVRTYDLIYSRTGGVTVIAQPEISVGLSLDHAVYSAADSPSLAARFAVRNTTSEPVSLSFDSSQMYDLEISDSKGSVVFRWSDGKAFAQVITFLALTDENDYMISASLAKLPPGKYVAQALLTVPGSARAYSASVGFEIR